MTAYFVTGTDTGVGKTTVTVALLGAAARAGYSVAGVKPAESGCAVDGGELVPADGRRLQRATTGEPELSQICCYRLRAPVAPNVAAVRDGVTIEFAVVKEAVDAWRPRDLVLVEGAGGLLVPLTADLDMAGLAAALELPLVIVARDALGTINHTLLTLAAARQRGLDVAGIILSATEPDTETAAQHNRAEIARLAGPGVPILGRLPYAPGASDDELASLGARHLDFRRLIVPRETVG